MNQNLFDRKVRAQLLLSRRVEGDTLVLPDDVLLASLRGIRSLTADERARLLQSPLTIRRLRQLSIGMRSAANDAGWEGSSGMLRAAATSASLERLETDDGYWSLDFMQQDGRWRTVLQVAPDAPFAARLLAERAWVRVADGKGALVLEGQLDADGECEAAWPFRDAPAEHFQATGARFSVRPAAPG